MRPENERKLAVGLGLVLLVVAAVCYIMLSPAASDEPVRLLFDGSAGDVLFTNQVHAQDYDRDCASCHHNLDDGDAVYSCRECHDEGGDAEDYPTTDAMHSQCISCHEEEGAGPVDCASCHATPK